MLRRTGLLLALLSATPACGSDSHRLGAPSGAAGNTVSTGGSASLPPGSAGGSTPSTAPVPSGMEPVEAVDVDAVPADVPAIGIELSEADQQRLEADLWGAEDVLGSFVGESGMRWEQVDVNYRGAYQLLNLVREGDTRNWKVKFPDEQAYLERREWNFNFEPHLRQKLAYDLMKFAGVRVPEAQHVILSVNGRSFGTYLRYADPDSKGWLKDLFGSAAGDLFKGAYDLPEQEKRFALLTYLGPNDSDYFLHYNKKLNNEGPALEDYSNLIAFIDGLNNTPLADLPAWFEANFDVERFISYLVVANFTCNWDSYPYRPKNYWLYQSPVTTKWSFIPWDMDGTFQTNESFNYPMSTDSSIFHEFDGYMGNSSGGATEGTERPLVRRMMAIGAYRDAYVARYRELSGTILSESYLTARIDRLRAMLEPHVSGGAADTLRYTDEDMKRFVRERVASVGSELASL